MKSASLFIAAILVLSGATARAAGPRYLAQPQTIEADGAFTQAASGMVFPAAIGDFRRVSLLRYDADGLEMSASYALITGGGGVAATVYVSPLAAAAASALAQTCAGEFAVLRQAVVAAHADARLLSDKDVSLAQGGATHPGRRAVFSYGESYGGVNHPLQSELYVFCDAGSRWEFEYRFSYPQGFDAATLDAGFMRDLRWTVAVWP